MKYTSPTSSCLSRCMREHDRSKNSRKLIESSETCQMPLYVAKRTVMHSKWHNTNINNTMAGASLSGFDQQQVLSVLILNNIK